MDMNAKQRYTSVVQSKRRDEERRKESKLKSKSKVELIQRERGDVMDTAAVDAAIGQSGATNPRCLGLTAR